MADFLTTILDAKKEETARRAAQRPLSAIRRDAEAMPPPRPFAAALEGFAHAQATAAPSLPPIAPMPPASGTDRNAAVLGTCPTMAHGGAASAASSHRTLAHFSSSTPQKASWDSLMGTVSKDAPVAPTRPPVRLIAEIKRASPSKGALCPNLDPAALAHAYARGGAAALSVLTDGPFFGGSLEDLTAARNAVSLPVLRKDFIVSDYQIYEARAAEADAVLLIVRAVSPSFLRDALALCQALGLAALTEVHDEADVETALACGAHILGVNNRNLKTFETSLETSIRLRSLIPEDRILVAESGIRNRADIERLRAAGIFRFLIGESLVRAKDPEAAVRALLDEDESGRMGLAEAPHAH